MQKHDIETFFTPLQLHHQHDFKVKKLRNAPFDFVRFVNVFGIFRWLESMSEYKRGLLGLGGGMQSTECHFSSFLIHTKLKKRMNEFNLLKSTKHNS